MESRVNILQFFFTFPERNWNMWVPGYGTEDFKQSKKLGSTEAHKQVCKDMLFNTCCVMILRTQICVIDSCS